MLERVLEPEVMDDAEEAAEYDLIDHSGVNAAFVRDLLAEWRRRVPLEEALIVDVGTGPAHIPMLVCQHASACRVSGVDRGHAMLVIGRRSVAAAGLSARVHLQQADGRRLPFRDGSAAVVMSNSLIHHLADPTPILREAARILQTGGLLFIRDLVRPDSLATLEALVTAHAAGQSTRQQQLLADSLRAALSVGEILALTSGLGLTRVRVSQTSDRHWTLVGEK